jgi:uncharacterized protein (DUF433 family)
MLAQLKQQRISLAQTSLGKPARTYPEGVYVDPEILAGDQIMKEGQAAVYAYEATALYSQSLRASSWVISDLTTVYSHQQSETDVKEYVRSLAESLCEEHPAIEMTDSVKGVPVIRGSRLAVGQILGRIYALGSIEAVAAFYQASVTRAQIQAALAFTQDFLETACEPLQVNG